MKIRVGVFFGGKSVEHEISIISGLQAFAALDRQKYEPVPVYITKEGHFYTGEAFGDITSYSDIPALLRAGSRVLPASEGSCVVLVRYPAKRLGGHVVNSIDAALPVVHGANVEDGALQGFFEVLGLPYTGPDVLSAALCMDKAISKTVLENAGVPVLPALMTNAFDWIKNPEAELRQIEAEFSYPVVVKPVNLGSSVGITRADTRDTLRHALDLSFKYASRALVEPSVVDPREINRAVLGDAESSRVSVCEEPRAKRSIPAELTREQEHTIRALAVKAFKTLGCNGTARVDFLLDNETGAIYVNEVNAIPGSLSFNLWESTGLSFSALLDEMLTLALKRHREKGNLTYTYDTNILSDVALGKESGKL